MIEVNPVPSAETPEATIDVAALLAENAALRERNELLTAVIAHSPAVVFAKDLAGRLTLANGRYDELANVGPGELLGKLDVEIFGPEAGAKIRENDHRVCESGRPQQIEELIPQRDGVHTYISIKFPLYDLAGRLTGLGGIATDITERKRVEEQRAALQQQIIEVQRAVLSELSTPILPIADSAIVMPLIGSIDPERARNILQALLEGLAARRARTAILDITGVRAVDVHVAEALVQAARAARLLGAEVVVTGVRPAVAQALVDVGAAGAFKTVGTLQEGIAQALARARR